MAQIGAAAIRDGLCRAPEAAKHHRQLRDSGEGVASSQPDFRRLVGQAKQVHAIHQAGSLDLCFTNRADN
jgi:hypothetical protein